MGQYFQYTGVGGSYNGIGLPTSTIIVAGATGEKVICQTPVPDNRVPVQGGVLISAEISIGSSAGGIATVLCRQSTLGTTTTVTGNVVANGGNIGIGTYSFQTGTQAGTVVAGGTQLTQTFQWVDYLGTNPLPVYQVTGSLSGGTATIVSAFVTVTPLAA